MPFLDEDGVTRLTKDYLDVFALKEELGESDGTNAGPIYELSAKCHAEQFSTTGKNLLPRGNARTTYGITFTVNADGSITANGTATGDVALSFISTTSFIDGNTYTLSGCPVGGSSSTYEILVRNTTSEKRIHDYGDGATFVFDPDSQDIRIVIHSGTTVSDLTFYPQLELGSTATEYEPYTGGTPSPSPDYPQEIQVVRGRNLLPTVATSQTKNGITFTVNADGSVTCNGTATANAILDIATKTSLTLVAGQTYTFTGTPSGGNSNTYFMVVSDDTTVTHWAYDSGVTFTPTDAFVANSYKVRIAVMSGVTCNNITFYPQLTLGSTPKPYMPYRHVGMKVLGKNLLDESILLGAAGWHQADDGSYYGQLNKMHEYTYNNNVFDIDFEPNTQYTMSVRTKTTQVGRKPYFFFRYADGTNSSSITIPDDMGTDWTDLTVTSAAGKSVSLFAISYNNTAIVYIDKLQVERGSEATPYEPYYLTIPIPLPQRGWVAGLPDGTSDILTLDGAGKCEWELADEETTTAATDGVTGTIGVDVLSTTGQIADGATVLYPLATPIHESKGYIEDWPTDIPEGATITIPELDALNVKYFVTNESISQYAEQWYNRAKDLDIAEVEDAIGDLTSVIANLVTHDQFYFGYDEVNGKKMISIFKRGDI